MSGLVLEMLRACQICLLCFVIFHVGILCQESFPLFCFNPVCFFFLLFVSMSALVSKSSTFLFCSIWISASSITSSFVVFFCVHRARVIICRADWAMASSWEESDEKWIVLVLDIPGLNIIGIIIIGHQWTLNHLHNHVLLITSSGPWRIRRRRKKKEERRKRARRRKRKGKACWTEIHQGMWLIFLWEWWSILWVCLVPWQWEVGDLTILSYSTSYATIDIPSYAECQGMNMSKAELKYWEEHGYYVHNEKVEQDQRSAMCWAINQSKYDSDDDEPSYLPPSLSYTSHDNRGHTTSSYLPRSPCVSSSYSQYWSKCP